MRYGHSASPRAQNKTRSSGAINLNIKNRVIFPEFSYLLVHMYRYDILHDTNATALIKLKRKNTNLKYSMRDACYFCALAWFKGDIHSLYLHTDKYTLYK